MQVPNRKRNGSVPVAARMRRVALVIVTALGVWHAADGRAGGEGAAPCPRGAEAENRFVSVFRRGDSLMVCFKRSTALFERGDDVEYTPSYGWRTARLNGPVLAVGEYLCDAYYVCNGRVRASDVVHDFNGFVVGRAGPVFSKVGSIRVTRDLHLAWISCRTGKHEPERFEHLRRRPGCVTKGHRDSVRIMWKDKTTRLAGSRTIDPLSLKLRDRRLSWKQGGRLRSYDVDRAPEGTPTPVATSPPA